MPEEDQLLLFEEESILASYIELACKGYNRITGPRGDDALEFRPDGLDELAGLLTAVAAGRLKRRLLPKVARDFGFHTQTVNDQMAYFATDAEGIDHLKALLAFVDRARRGEGSLIFAYSD